MGGFVRWLRYVPVAVLIAVALLQLLLAHTAHLSPWAGGGFGMFSTTDTGSNRHLHVLAFWPGIELEIHPPRALEDLERRLRVLPSDSNLRAYAHAVADTLVLDPQPPTAVRVTLWCTRFDSDTLAPSSSVLRDLEVPIERD
jgi:hypothetical protein